ncbi:MAG TPA: hypothetical protein VEW46_15785 [Pyrinomonadaceae bacterium]|nr:hypothetical protein [Pyrinomonadaceae bacterium]
MNREWLKFRQVINWSLVVLLLMALAPTMLAQHEGHTMPNMSKPKPKTTPRRKARRKPRRKTAAQRPKSAQPAAIPAAPGHAGHTPGMVMPSPAASPAPASSPHTMHTSDTPKPASSPDARPQESPGQHEMHMPKTTPSPSASPHQMDVHTPASHPSPDPVQQSHGAMGHTKPEAAKPAESSAGTHPAGGHKMNTASLMVMSGDDMGIRVGASDTNVMPMGQMGSGTSWQPASTRMNMLHKSAGDWLLMFHYNFLAGLNSQGGPRGVTKFESANWFMPMAFRKVGPGTLELRSMFSFEPFTFPPGGSPLLFQTGETYKGRPIIDAQHPHDLFMELSASYTVPLGDRATWFAYVGYPGEPALGPTAFMHRASASENPAAALSHHLQDSSHISFGVFTTGFTYRWFKLEGSVFNGREPDENRYNLEAHRWNSRSARLSFAPNSNWSMQISHGLLRDPEALEPGDVRRTTASVTYNKPLVRGSWATSLIWGRNHENHGGEIFDLNGYVAESTVNFLDKNYLYTRLELVDKNALLRDADRAQLGITDHHPLFRIGAYTFGGARDFYTTEKLRIAVGGDATFYSKPAILDSIYGSNPVSYRVFLRFRPGKMSMAGHADPHQGMKH